MHLPPRPLSPHLQIYKLTLTMLMSIAHRITGLLLYGTISCLSIALFLLACGESSFSYVTSFLHSFVGTGLLLVITWALFHHALGGIRHLVWDTGHGFSLPTAEKMARLTLIGSFTFTLVTWGAACFLL